MCLPFVCDMIVPCADTGGANTQVRPYHASRRGRPMCLPFVCDMIVPSADTGGEHACFR